MQIRHTLVLTTLLLVGCAKDRVVIDPVVVTREVVVVRPLPDALLLVQPLPFGPLRDCPTVARQRLQDLQACYNRLDQIRAIQQGDEHDGQDRAD